jgi:hypothetical protein
LYKKITDFYRRSKPTQNFRALTSLFKWRLDEKIDKELNEEYQGASPDSKIGILF